jgi:hypothetical protein
VAEIDTTRADLINQVEAARKDLLGKADAQFSTIQSESFRQITEFRSMADRRLGPGFQYVNEISGAIEPYRAMPLLANNNTLNANGLATSAPRFWGNS